MFITESWFWRGTQSAIFYYISCSPCLEFQYKRKRRREAVRAEKERAEIITLQPGLIVQPGPFQTNPDWAEEIIVGPGPPKGWKKEKILQGYTESARQKYRNETRTSPLPNTLVDGFDFDVIDDRVDEDEKTIPFPDVDNNQSSVASPNVCLEGPSKPAANTSTSGKSTSQSVGDSAVDTATATAANQTKEQHKHRPSMDQRFSSAVVTLRHTFKGWNLKRYEREDEILSGLNERINKIWDKATSHTLERGAEIRRTSVSGRKRARTNDSDRYDYQRAVRNPEINELHPPTVSKLPTTKDEAAWMLLPPPSAAVMAGRSRPQDEPALRWPLAQIGRDPDEWEQVRVVKHPTRSRISASSVSTRESGRMPDLSNSSSDEGWSDEEDREGPLADNLKRYSAPVEGWIPVMPALPKTSVNAMQPAMEQWQRHERWKQQRVK